MKTISLVLAALLLVSGCDDGQDTAAVPPPVTPDREAITYFGRMILLDHQGPKAQILLSSAVKEGDGPLWFPSVRDAVAFTKLPGEPKDIAAIYVTDMARAESWDDPQVWIEPTAAVYVIESAMHGGMGAPEAVPFSDRQAAESFVARHGGRIVDWSEIPEDYVLSDGHAPMPGHSSGADLPAMTVTGALDLSAPGALCTSEGGGSR